MKKLVLVFAIFVTANVTAQKINWVTLDEAIELQKKTPKKIIMDVYTTWCGPCKLLDKNTFQNKDVAAYINEHYYAVKFNAEGNSEVTYKGTVFKNPDYVPNKRGRNSAHMLSTYLRITGYPSLVYFDEAGELITAMAGYQNPQQLELYLKVFKTDKYKEFKSQEEFGEYASSFKPVFKG